MGRRDRKMTKKQERMKGQKLLQRMVEKRKDKKGGNRKENNSQKWNN